MYKIQEYVLVTISQGYLVIFGTNDNVLDSEEL